MKQFEGLFDLVVRHADPCVPDRQAQPAIPFRSDSDANRPTRRGELDSIYRDYYYGGQLALEGQYRLGEKTGDWKSYFPNGKLKSAEKYLNGELTGKVAVGIYF